MRKYTLVDKATGEETEAEPREKGGPVIKAGVLDKSLEHGPVGLCGPAPLWTTCRTTYGGQTGWQVVKGCLGPLKLCHYLSVTGGKKDGSETVFG